MTNYQHLLEANKIYFANESTGGDRLRAYDVIFDHITGAYAAECDAMADQQDELEQAQRMETR